jgi:acyl-coenzyme A thioesterase PaaI-like protein
MADMLIVLGANVQTGLNRFMTTVSLSADFMAAVGQDAWLEGRLDILRTTRTLVFCQGIYSVDGAPVLRVDGIVKPIGEEKPDGSSRRYFE